MAKHLDSSDSTLWRNISIAVILALALRFVSLAFPDLRLWGLNYFRFMPLTLTIASSSAILLLLIPSLRNRILRYIDSHTDSTANSLFLVVSTLFTIIVLLFPMETFFLGDGGMLVGEMFKLMQLDGYNSDVILDYKSSPLAGLILHGTAKVLPFLFKTFGISASIQPMLPYRGLSLISLLVLCIYLYRSHQGTERLTMLIAFLGTAGVLLFFGYVESYSLIYVASGIYVLAAVKHLNGKSGVMPVVVAYLFAVFSHFHTLALLPSFIYLLTAKRLPEKYISRKYALVLIGSSALLWTLFYFISGLYATDSRVVIPFNTLTTDAGTYAYSLLSSEHLWDLFNLVFLLVSIPAIFLLIHKHVKDSVSSVFVSPFLVLVIGFFAMFAVFANTMYGLPRDWDLMSPLGIIIMLSALVAMVKASQQSWATALYVSCLSFLLILPWIAVNLDNDAAKDRAYELIRQDEAMIYPYLSIAGYEALRKQYLHEKNPDMEQEILMRMVGLQDHPDMYNMLISNSYNHYLYNTERLDAINNWMLHRVDSVAGVLENNGTTWHWHTAYKLDSLVAGIGYYAYMNKRLSAFIDEYIAVTRRHGFQIGINAINGMNAYREAKYELTAKYLSHVIEQQFYTPKIVGMLASSYMILGDTDASAKAFSDGFVRFPEDAELRVVRAVGLLQDQDRIPEARKYFHEAAALNPPPDMQQLIRSYLQKLQ
jgi:tetratricopeptide (TPR) repeat protein